MTKPTGGDREDLEAELDALSAELLDARAVIEGLERALEGTSRDAVVTVDADGRVGAVTSWPWPDPPGVGDPISAPFDPGSGAEVARSAQRRWIGIGEQRLKLRSGRAVQLVVRPVDAGFRMELTDTTARDVLDQATEQRKRMRAVSQLAGTLARELTDPMSVVQGRLELLLELAVTDPVAVRRHLTVALDHSRRVTATLRNLRLVGRTAEPPTRPVAVRSVMDEVLDLLGPRASRVVVRIDPEGLEIGCDSALPARVCASLTRQALEGGGAHGTIQLAAYRVRTRVVVRIGPSGRATGDPITEVDDLALDRTLLASVGGSLVARRSGAASRFEITLPTPTAPRARRRKVRGSILVVGPVVAQAIPVLLERDGYDFVQARTTDQAVHSLEETPCAAVIAEVLLEGGVSGLALADIVADRFADTRVILVLEGEDPPALPLPVIPVRWPASRAEILAALGHRVRH